MKIEFRCWLVTDYPRPTSCALHSRLRTGSGLLQRRREAILTRRCDVRLMLSEANKRVCLWGICESWCADNDGGW